jgi:DNA-binding transcriptional LysR family regulator
MIDLYKLRHFVAVARTGSYVAAADELHISQPALSRSVQALENQLGVKLLDRSRSGVHPTAVGVHFLDQADDLLNLAAGLEERFTAAADGEGGTVQFGIGPMIASIILPDCSTALLRDHPGIHTRVFIDSAEAMNAKLLAGAIEFFIGQIEPSPDAARLDIEVIGEAGPCFLVRHGHPLADRGRIETQKLKEYPRISGTAWSEAQAGTWGRKRPQIFASSLEVDNYDLLRKTALETDAILITSYGVEPDGLVMIDVDFEPDATPQIGIHKLASRSLSPSAQTVLQLLRKALATRTDLA